MAGVSRYAPGRSTRGLGFCPLARLAGTPEIGRLREFRNPRLVGLRSWPVPGFEKHLILYRAEEGFVEIVRVLHSARDLAFVLEDGG